MNVDYFNDYATVTRNIIFRNEREPFASLKEFRDAANQIPVDSENIPKVEMPMKEFTEGMKNSWVV